MGRSFKDMADQLRQVVKSGLPLAYATILEEFGQDAKHDAKENLIGLTAPFQGVTLPETGQAFGPWEEHSPVTPELKAASGGGKGGNPDTYLYDTGEMYGSVEYKVISRSVYLGSNSDHAYDTEYGDPFRHVPSRPFLGPAIIRTAIRRKKIMAQQITAALCGRKVS